MNNNLIIQLICISKEKEGQIIYHFLRRTFPLISKRMVDRILRKGEVQVNKFRIHIYYPLILGDLVSIQNLPVSQYKKETIYENINKVASMDNFILYEDNYLLLINKPSGISVHGGSGNKLGVIEFLRSLRKNSHFLSLVHRIDRETSGVLLVAKKNYILRLLQKKIKNKKIKKYYFTLVRGKLHSQCQVIKAPLLKNILHNGIRVVRVNREGKKSETIIKKKEIYSSFATLVKANPISGRTHQIRVHMLYSGHTIAFDDKYGDNEFDKKIRKSKLKRLFLHSISLQFSHPVTRKKLKIESPLDEELRYCLQVLRIKKFYTIFENNSFCITKKR